MELMIVAGEASGDTHAAELVAELRRRHPDLHCFGCGGDALEAAGCELLVSISELAVMGLFEVVRHLPRLHRHYRRLRGALRRRRPAGIVLVDFPDFNLRLARAARRAGIPVVYFISPQIWAWRRGRVRHIRRDVRRMICIFPFEADFYARHGIEVAAVGHPLVERVHASVQRQVPSATFRQQHDLDPAAPIVALLPGSRRREIDFHLETLLEAARRLHARRDIQFLLPVAPTLNIEELRGAIPPPLRSYVHLLDARIADATYAALALARVAVVASGTATVETALLRTPMVVFYRLSGWSYRLGRRWVKTPHVAMANLIAGKRVVPELIQKEFNAEAIVNWVERLMEEGDERRHMVAELAVVGNRLGEPGVSPSAIQGAATVVEQTLALVPGPGCTP